MTETTAEQRDQARRLVDTVTIFPGLVEILAPLLADAERLAEIEAEMNGLWSQLAECADIEEQRMALQRILNGGESDE